MESRLVYLLILQSDHGGDDDEIQLLSLFLYVSEKLACKEVVVSLYPGNQPALKDVKCPAVGDKATGEFFVKGNATIEPTLADLPIGTFRTSDSLGGCLALFRSVDLIDGFDYRLKLFFNCG